MWIIGNGASGPQRAETVMFRRLLPLAALAASHAPPVRSAAAATPLRAQEDALPAAIAGRPYSYALAGLGGAAPYSFSCTGACVVPPGLSLASSGVLSGTPAAAGHFTMNLLLTDAQLTRANAQVTLEILRAEAIDAWCPRGRQGGPFTAVAVDPAFATNGRAVAASVRGGVMTSGDGGQSWTPVAGFGNFRVAALAIDLCPGGVNNPSWAVTLPSGYFGLTGGAILRNVGGAPSLEIQDPAGWSGARRRIRETYQGCDAPMLASDNEGGVLYRTAGLSGTWSAANGGLPLVAGKFPVMDIALGYAGAPATAFALLSDNGNGSAALYRASGLPAGRWSSCPVFGPSAQGWQGLGLAPDGLALAGAADGTIKWFDTAAACSSGSPPSAAPPLRDQGVVVTPAINGFAFDGCYSAGTSGKRGVYVYTTAGIFYSADPFDGISPSPFDKISRGLLSENVLDLEASPACADRRLVAATARRGIAYGNVAGFCPARLGGGDTVDLAGFAAAAGFVSAAGACSTTPAVPGLHAAASGSGLYRPTGRALIAAGDTREQNFLDLGAAVVAPGNGSVIDASTASGVYESRDGGLSYPLFRPTAEPLARIAEGGGSANGRLYGMGAAGVYANFTGWALLAAYPAVTGAQALDMAPGASQSPAPDPLDDAQWIAYGGGGVLELYNTAGAAAFTRSALNGSALRVGASQMRGASNLVFAQVQPLTGGAPQLHAGIKPGGAPGATVNFAQLASDSSLPAETAQQIAVEPAVNIAGNAGHVFIAYPKAGLWRSTNLGATAFTQAGSGLPNAAKILKVVLARDYNSALGRTRLAVLVDGRGIYYSNDAGATFCGPLPVAPLPVELRALATNDDARLFAGHDFGVSFSGDRGASWSTRTFANAPVHALLAPPSGPRILAGAGDGIWRSDDDGRTWIHAYSATAPVTAFTRDAAGTTIAAALSGGGVLLSTDGGNTFSPQASPSDPGALDYNAATTLAAGATAAYWMAGAATGAGWSANGAAWNAANGANPDYTLALTGNWQSVASLGGAPSKVLIGNGVQGLWRTLDGGDGWRKVSGAGSGLETTSQNASALLTAATAYATTDALVGMTGAATGGVYLSGDNGEHWTQINQGFDPANQSITSMVKTSCNGCPVQYYSGSYGNGVYTRTITVSAPPAVTAWCFGATPCACGTAAPSGPEAGGQPFQLCGGNFQAGVAVEFDGVAATGCSLGGGMITCAGTPPHFPGGATIRVRNPDTRQGVMGQAYTYALSGSRVSNLRVAKSGNDAALSWSCPSCNASAPARVWRSQNAPFTQYIEQYTGGTGAYTNAGALGAATYRTYFWNVE